MQQFNTKLTCSKCGDSGIKSLFCKGAVAARTCWKYGIGVREEHLHRACGQCGYEWFESCIDSNLATSNLYVVQGKERLAA